MATIEEILANADTGRYNTNQNNFSYNMNNIGSSRGANQNYGIVNAPMNLANAEEEFNAGTMYTTNPESSFTNASVLPNSSAPGFDNRFTGILQNTVTRPLLFQAGANVGLGASKLLGVTNPFLALAGAIGSQFLPLGRSKPAFDYQYVNQPGGVNVVDNKITTGVLAGKNFESAFGSKSLGEMYQNYIDNLEEEDELTDFQQQRLDDAKAELRAYLTTGAKMRGYRDSVTNRTMTPREFAFNYNQGIGQFAMPTTDATGKTLDYTGESDTYSGGESTPGDDTSYSDPYDPGGGE